jgi:hypothetical protein
VFNPSKDDVRRFFCDTWRKHRSGSVLTPLETIALDWIMRHPEYHSELEDAEAAAFRDYRVEDGRTNPFLHLSMHLAIAEQVSIDQPPGIRAAYLKLAARLGDDHAAVHEVMECLGEVVWSAQQTVAPMHPSEMSARYLECLERRLARASGTGG